MGPANADGLEETDITSSYVDPFLPNAGVFDPEALAAVDNAFDAACKALHDSGQPEMVLKILAQRIIEAASRGERDPVRMVEAALPWLTREQV